MVQQSAWELFPQDLRVTRHESHEIAHCRMSRAQSFLQSDRLPGKDMPDSAELSDIDVTCCAPGSLSHCNMISCPACKLNALLACTFCKACQLSTWACPRMAALRLLQIWEGCAHDPNNIQEIPECSSLRRFAKLTAMTRSDGITPDAVQGQDLRRR